MGREDRRFGAVEEVELGPYLARHVDEAVERAGHIARQQPVHRTAFVREHVVHDRHRPGTAAPGDPADGSQRRGHLRKPVADDQQVGPLAPDAQAGTDPVQRIHRVQYARDVEPFRGWRVGKLALARKQEGRVLQRERIEPAGYSRPVQRAGQQMVEVGQSSPIRVGGAEQHGIRRSFHFGSFECSSAISWSM